MFCMLKMKKTYPTYVSKYYSKCEKQVMFWMIPNGEKRKWSKNLAKQDKPQDTKLSPKNNNDDIILQ